MFWHFSATHINLQTFNLHFVCVSEVNVPDLNYLMNDPSWKKDLKCCKPDRYWSAKLHVQQVINRVIECNIPEDENNKLSKNNWEPHMSYIITKDDIVCIKSCLEIENLSHALLFQWHIRKKVTSIMIQ